jgi:hypothetical protein
MFSVVLILVDTLSTDSISVIIWDVSNFAIPVIIGNDFTVPILFLMTTVIWGAAPLIEFDEYQVVATKGKFGHPKSLTIHLLFVSIVSILLTLGRLTVLYISPDTISLIAILSYLIGAISVPLGTIYFLNELKAELDQSDALV